jgi:hypothetical protein
MNGISAKKRWIKREKFVFGCIFVATEDIWMKLGIGVQYIVALGVLQCRL